ncbi:hypothetical protein [Vibrio owensii]|uniref:hypothetical protein n=1 Tax=Vibrio owensii TaxID=696485 RepID=UPI00390AC5D4
MKKTVIALLTAATLSSSAFAAVSDAHFQWGGLIPPAELTSPDVCIDNTGLVDHMNGVLEFSNDGKNINLVDASDLSFKVMDNACGKDTDLGPTTSDIAYGYTLQTTAVSVGGLTDMNPTSPIQEWIHVTADTTELPHGIKQDATAGQITTLSVAQNAALPNTDALYPELDGQDVLVLAILEVTDNAL